MTQRYDIYVEIVLDETGFEHILKLEEKVASFQQAKLLAKAFEKLHPQITVTVMHHQQERFRCKF